MSVHVVCADVFSARLPLGQARLVYADPPYTHEDKHGYGTWPGAERLVRRMLELGADDAAFVLHCGSPALGEVLPVVEELAPRRPVRFAGQPKYRLLAWTKPWRRSSPREYVAWRFMWEPVVLWFGRGYRNPRDLAEADWICALRSERSANGHATQKPDDVLLWLFERLLAGAEGRLAVDLFAGTGGAAIMAARMGLDAIAVERDARFARLIREDALRPAQVAGYLPAVRVNGHGVPLWSTLGRVELVDDLAERAQRAGQGQQAHVPTSGPEVDARLEEGAAVGEVEAEAPPAPERLHLGHRGHGGIVAAAEDAP